MRELVLYIPGRGGSAAESEHYAPLFPGCAVTGLDVRGETPWEAGEEIRSAVEKLAGRYAGITLIANSIGAFYSLYADIDRLICRTYFISPLVDMEQMILSLLRQTGATEDDLRQHGTLPAPFGETLVWDELCFVRTHPVSWRVPTRILCGGKDTLVPFWTVRAFSQKTGAKVTVMDAAAHWFHTPAELAFLDRWIKEPWTKTE